MTSVPTTSRSSKSVRTVPATESGGVGRGRRRAAIRLGVLAAMLPLVAVPVAAAATVEPTPAATTVLTLSPFSTISVMANQLQGSLSRAPNNCEPVNWDQRLYVPAGVTALDAAMKAQSDTPYVVFGYSQGAEVVEQWLKDHADDPNPPDPKNVKFVLIGNPTRVYGGTGSLFGEVVPQTDYQIVDISREYDFASDFPNKPLSPFYMLAIANALAGFLTVHLDYEGVNINDPANLVWTKDHSTYILVPTADLPLLAPLRAVGMDTAALNAVLKPLVDSAYDRTYGGTVSPQPTVVSADSPTQFTSPVPAVEPAMRLDVASPRTRPALSSPASSEPEPAVVGVAQDVEADETATVTAVAQSSDAAGADTGGSTQTRITGGNKFEPSPTASTGVTTVGGQKHPGSKSIGSTLGKIIKSLRKALTHD